MDKDFSVTISFNIEKKGSPFASTTQEYSGMTYDEMQGLQRVVLGTLVETLLSMGDALMSAEGIEELKTMLGQSTKQEEPEKQEKSASRY